MPRSLASGLTRGQRRARAVTSTLLYAILSIGAFVAILPFYWMVNLGTLSVDKVYVVPPRLLPGDQFFMNVAELLQQVPYLRNYANSLIVSVTQTALVLFFCSLAGFAFAKRDFPAKNTLFLFMMGTMFVPVWAGIVPWFLIIRALGLIDKLYGIIIPGAVSAMGVFWMRQTASQSIPDELLDAARIDGCGEFGTFFRVALPVLRPGLGALAIMTFMGSWNSFLGPLLILQSVENFTLPIVLRTLLTTTGTKPTPWGALMAGTAIATLPIIIIFVFSSRQFISGLTAGALKG